MTEHQPILPEAPQQNDLAVEVPKLTFPAAKKRCKHMATQQSGVWHVTRTESGAWLVVIDPVLARNTDLKSYYWHNQYSPRQPHADVQQATLYEKILHRL